MNLEKCLIRNGFNEWLISLDVAPYPSMFFNIPKFIQNAYIRKWLKDQHNIIIQPHYDEISSISCDIKPTLKLFKINDEIGSCILINQHTSNREFDSDESALEFGIIESLNFIEKSS
jgi:hypothetical protein